MPLLNVWKRLRSLVTRPIRDLEAMQFSLGERRRPAKAGARVGRKPGKGGPGGGGRGKAGRGGGRKSHGPQRLVGGVWPGQRQPARDQARGEPIPKNIEAALKLLSEIFHYPQSTDLIIRKFLLLTRPPARAFIVYYDGLADTKRVEREILEPLMSLPQRNKTPKARLGELVLNTLLPAGGSQRKETVAEVVAGVTQGQAAVVVEPGGYALLVDIKAPPTRQPDEPLTERTIRGPQLGFVESHRTNTAMIRNFIHDPDLVLEAYTVGRRSNTLVSIMYIADIANPELVAEVRRRLKSLDVDSVIDSGYLEKLIEDHPLSLVPTVLNTERPDRVAGQILQGAVGLIVDGSTRALVVPVTFSTGLHSGEDAYLRYAFTTFLRVLRLVAALLALTFPAIYVAVSNYHQEMLPNLLVMTFLAARQAIPFPLLFSVLFLDLSFELIREAGIRIPSAIGPTIGIVGALLIGDMAVRSSLVSPVTVIVIAITALANFAIPDFPVGFAIRFGRFMFTILAGVLGFYGLALGLFVTAAHLASLRSFGVPYLSPIGPWRAGSMDVILRSPQWDQEKRPIFLRPLDLIRQARYARGWEPGVPPTPRKGRGNGGREDGGGGEGSP